MNSGVDERILEALDYGLTLTPAVIAKNIGYSREYVSRRLSVLLERGFVSREGTGYYTLTDDGKRFLDDPD